MHKTCVKYFFNLISLCVGFLQMMINENRKHEDPYRLELHNAPPTLDLMARLERYVPTIYKVMCFDVTGDSRSEEV